MYQGEGYLQQESYGLRKGCWVVRGKKKMIQWVGMQIRMPKLDKYWQHLQSIRVKVFLRWLQMVRLEIVVIVVRPIQFSGETSAGRKKTKRE